MKKRYCGVIIAMLVVLSVLTLSACGGGGSSSSGGGSAPADTGSADGSAETTDAAGKAGIHIEPLTDDGSGAILNLADAKGPNGEEPAGVEDILNLISDEKAEEIRSAGYTAAISLHTVGTDWSVLQLEGMHDVLDEFNIKVIAETDAEMEVEKQVSDLESIIGMKPDLLISFVLDGDAVGPVLKEARAQGIQVSLIDSVPAGFTPGTDYAGMGTADNYANGAASAQKLADYLGGEGEIAMLNYVSSLFHTDARTQGARDVFAQYPDITIVAEDKVNSAETAATATEAMLTAHPDIAGIWTFWDVPGMGAVGVIESMGKDTKVVSVDLSEDTAYSIASGGAMLASGAQHPYDQGVAEAMIGVAALAEIEPPSYVLVPGEIVTKESMSKSWERVFRSPLPDDMKAILEE
ncbi:MAG: substrate-binding domain-containing protein [Clostridiales Family XIII bacterium]|nr:substrate-binding domain-containing protein [Clostridiales Family XIII bacterium]